MADRSAKLRALVTTVAAVILLAGACSDGGNPEVPKSNGDAGGAGGAAGTGGKPDAGGEDGPLDSGSDSYATDAPLSPVRLGIIPVPPSSGDAGPTASDEKLAQLDVIALGSRGVSQVLRWSTLYDSPSVASVAEWAKLQGLAQLYQGSGRELLVCLALVDRTLDARPPGSSVSWNDTPTRDALDALIDKVFATFGDELYALSFGNEVDRYFASQSAKNAADFAALLEHGVDYAKKHPARPPALIVGATLSSDALTKNGSPLVAKLLAKSDVAIVNYYPLDAAYKVRPPTQAGQDLDALTSSLAGDGGVDAETDAEAGLLRPVLLQEVGYPSATENGSSPEQQRAFFQALFQALATRRERFPFVSVNGLHEPHPARCASEAAALGAPGVSAAVAARCSLGLNTADQSAKPALDSVLAGLAAFSTP